MPNDKKSGPMFSYLEQLSRDELEDLLFRDFVSSRETEPDPAYIMEIMEVIKKKEMEIPTEPAVDVDAAWRVFQEDYQGQSDAFESVYLHDDSSHHPNQINKPKKAARWRKVLRTAIAAAVIVLALGGVASALGLNVFQAVASWTAEVFGFAEQSVVQYDPFEEIRNAVKAETALSVIPNWAPEGTQPVSSVTAEKYLYGEKIRGAFETENGLFSITVYKYIEPNEESTVIYQKDKSEMVEYQVNGMTYYVMNNNGKATAAWSNENIEVQVQGALSTEDLILMINSIYEE